MRTRKGSKKLDTHSLTKLTFDFSPLFLSYSKLFLKPLGNRCFVYLQEQVPLLVPYNLYSCFAFAQLSELEGVRRSYRPLASCS